LRAGIPSRGHLVGGVVTPRRDTKLAIVMFVREKGLTGILKKAKTTLAAHPQFVAWQDASSETELRATVRWPKDNERRADLSVFFVHTPRTKS
jgi:hypothetical protein